VTFASQGQPLPELFSRAQELFARVEGGGGGEATQDAVRQALELLDRCAAAVERLGLFSRWALERSVQNLGRPRTCGGCNIDRDP